MKITKVILFIFSFFILGVFSSVSATTVSDSVTVYVVSTCPDPQSETQSTVCPTGTTGTATQTRIKTPTTCVFGSWVIDTTKCIPNGAAIGTLTGPASCTIGTGNSSCPATVTWNVANPVTGKPTAVTADKPVANTTIGSGNSGSVSTPIGNGTTYFYLYHNGIESAPRLPISGSCDPSKDIWDGTKCVKTTNSWVMPSCTNTACGSLAVTIPYTCPTGNCAPLPAPTRICPAAEACPTVSLQAVPSSIRKGGSTTVKWENALPTCTAKSNNFTFDGSPTGQNVVTNIQKSTTFILSCGGTDYPAKVTVDTTTFIEQ